MAIKRAAAFSLIELLVVIAIVAVLLALALPALRKARHAGRQTICLSNLKNLAAAVEFYTHSSKGAYPFAPAGTALLMSPEGEPNPSHLTSSDHWDLASNWPGLMHRVAPWRDFYATWVCPGSRRNPAEPWRNNAGAVSPSYAYSNSFIARPQLWSPTGIADPALLKGTRNDEVLAPSAKAFFFDQEMAHAAADTAKPSQPVLFADAHAALKHAHQATQPVPNPFTGAANPWHDTPNGIQGRDE